MLLKFFSSSSSSQKAIFDERRKKQDVWRLMRRIIDRHAASGLVLDNETRSEPRRALSIPVLIQAFDEHNMLDPVFALTKNVSDDGMAIINTSAFKDVKIFCAVWEEHPLCFIGTVCHTNPIGAGFWETGIDFIELASLNDWEHLREHVMSLAPQG